MDINEIIERFTEKDYLLNMGSGKLAKMFKTTKDEIKKAKNVVRGVLPNPKGTSKILILDIETAPIKAYIWGLWNQNIHIESILSEWFMLTWSAKWLFNDRILSDRLTASEAIHEDDKRIVESISKLLDEADIVVAHHGDRFDMPRIRSRMLINNLSPVSPYRQIDTKKIASKEFGFSSNKLDSLAGLFGIEHKVKTDMSLWIGCLEGNTAALREMEIYNKKDVEILEKVYLKLRPWMKSHPNVNMTAEPDVMSCPVCGSTRVSEYGMYYTNTNKYKSYKCKDCGAISRERLSEYPTEKKKIILVSVPK